MRGIKIEGLKINQQFSVTRKEDVASDYFSVHHSSSISLLNPIPSLSIPPSKLFSAYCFVIYGGGMERKGIGFKSEIEKVRVI